MRPLRGQIVGESRKMAMPIIRSWRRGRSMQDDTITKKQLENSHDIFLELNTKATNVAKRLTLLNGLVKLIDLTQSDGRIGFTTEEILYCLRTSLVYEFTQVRAGALRVIRHLLRTPRDLQLFNDLQLTQLLCRSLDILLDNEEERVQALKLIRKMLSISPDMINPMIVRSLVSLGESGIEDGDRMLRACLAILCEIGVLNSALLIVCGGVSAITRNVLECHSPRIAESLCGVLLHLLEWPQTRNLAGVRLDCLAAPYCDFTYRLGIMDKNKHARDLRFTCSRLALLSVLRSWAGTIEFCDPNKPSGLKAIVDILYLNQLEVRKAILDLLYELLWLPQPVWTDEYSVALGAIDPADYQDAWRLAEGFVAMEGRNVLPSLAKCVPNITEIHTSLLLYCFLETGLLNALVEVVVSSAAFISVRATILIGKLLQLMHSHLPTDICNTSSALPTLISYATQGNHQASAAVTALQNLHQILKSRPASCSLFLDVIIQSGSMVNSDIFKRDIESSETVTPLPYFGTIERLRHDSISSSTSNSGDEPNASLSTLGRASGRRKKFLQIFDSYRQSENLIKDSNVFLNDDGITWDWEIIATILIRTNTSSKMDLKFIRFLRRLVHFFKPSSNRFSHQDLGHSRYLPPYVTAGVRLIDWLVESAEMESIRLLTDYFADIDAQLVAINTAKSAHDCLFSPQHMNSTMCQQYFLYIGRMCRTKIGVNILSNTHIFKHLIQLVTSTIHVCYIKLIVSGLDYSFDEMPRLVLERALTTSERSAGRLYATQFMLVLMRAKIPNFEVWGLPMIIRQTKDKDRTVALYAMEVLDEACHERAYLEELVSLWPDFSPMGDRGKLLTTRFYSLPRGLNHPKSTIQFEIESWVSTFNKRYVLLVEADTHATLTLHTKNEDGTYSRRTCSSRSAIMPPNILPHLYGQLVQTDQGLENLTKYGQLQRLFEILLQAKCSDEKESLLLKSAMWALGHISTSARGVDLLCDPVIRVYEKILDLAKECEVYSIRATALHVLGLIGSTKSGANVLFKNDWMCVRHNRDTLWPVCETEDWLSKHLTPIRHHIDKVPPYNYTGIEDSINGIFSSNNETNSFYLPDPCDVSKEDVTAESDGPVNTSKSRTLPVTNNKSMLLKHKRSLSESKTTDGISPISTANHYISRTRFNSGTDSNTSGVSSYESVFGVVLGDLGKTLSPIPSSSNLLEVKKPTDRFRKTSLTGASFREPTISPQDAQGYAKLRSLRRYQRPMLSESAADELADIIDGNIRASSKLSIAQQQRKLKVRSLDRYSNLMEFGSMHDVSPTNDITSPYSSYSSYTLGPCYKGICLPKNILDLFPQRSMSGTYVTRFNQDADLMDLPTSIKQQVMVEFMSECDESSVSSLSDISSTTSKRSKANEPRHNRNLCLLCCRSTQPTHSPSKEYLILPSGQKTVDTMVTEVDGPNSSIALVPTGSTTTTTIPTAGASSSTTITTTTTNMTPQRRKNGRVNLYIYDNTFNSPDSLLHEENSNERIANMILLHVQRMANPVWSKQSRMALFKLKQAHQHVFQDICVYSEVCKALGRNTYRLNARRFLQELFMDLDYEVFYAEALDIIRTKESDISACDVTMDFDVISTPSTNSSALTSSTTISSRALATSSPNEKSRQLYNHHLWLTKSSTGSDIRSSSSPSVATVVVNSTTVSSIGAAPYSIKTHLLKSPPLASVYETSRENLSESFGNSSKIMNSTSININMNNNICNSNNKNCNDNSFDQPDSVISSTPKTTVELNQRSISHDYTTSNDRRTYSRPRFNTLELDLSCTKNKFPITDRRKNFDSVTSIISNRALYSQRITKSLSASITTPTSVLFCEKRLSTSKSEAILSNHVTTTPMANCEQVTFRK